MVELDRDLRRRVAAAPVAHLATIRPDGRPHVVVITFALDVDDDRIVTAIDHKPKSTRSLQRLRNIAANPQTTVLVDHYEDDWSRLWWVRADGYAAVLETGSQRQRALRHLVAKYPQYRQQLPEGPVISVVVDRWASWEA